MPATDFRHVTIDGTSYGIDADGYVFAPDERTCLGRVARVGDRPDEWASEPESQKGAVHASRTREEAIRHLIAKAAAAGPEVAVRESGEDGIRVETVIVTERNVALQVVREVVVERTFEAGVERQTTVRAYGYETLTSEAHEERALPPEEARRYIADCEQRELLTK